jgi:hypothetical protein
MNKSYIFPVALIVAGTLLLLNQFDLLYLSRPYLFIIAFTVIGLILIRKSLMSPVRKGMLGGSFFLMLAVMVLLLDIGFMPFYDELIVASILIALGIANVIYYLFSRKSFTNVTFGLIFIAAGMPFLIIYFGSVSYWEVADAFSKYWPVLLITAGLGFLADGMFRKAK